MNLRKKRLQRNVERDAHVVRQAAMFRLAEDLVGLIDEGEICDCVVKGLKETLGYDFLALFFVEAETKNRVLAASVGFRDPISPLSPGEGVSEKSLLTGELQYTPDVSKHKRYSYGMGGSEVDVPIIIEREVIGILIAESKQKNDFDDNDFEILTASAHILGLALEKARILSKERSRVKELEALRKTMTEVTAELGLQELLATIVDRAADLLDASGGELGLIDDSGEYIQMVVSYNLGKDYIGQVQKIGDGLMGKVAQTRKAMIVDDYATWGGKISAYSNIHAAMGAPLIVGKRLLGVFTTVRSEEERKFNSNDLHLLNLFAQQAAIAVENARLFDQAQQEIEKRKKIQEEISRQKEYYEALLVNNPVAVVSADLNGNVISWNPMAEKLFGYSEEEVIGKQLDDFVANQEELIDEARDNTFYVLNLGRVQKTTKRTRRDGSLVDVELLALPTILNGEKVGFIALYHDITERKRFERELRAKNEKMTKELQLAGEIQTSFLPRKMPKVRGWEMIAKLIPARETSGDFYDVQQLSDGKMALLIADVVDKGVGAALFMAMCWSLLRTFTAENPDDPDMVFKATNHHIINDTKTSQFITAFYGILDMNSGELQYCNAGHSPPILVRGRESTELIRTGIPLGVQSGTVWEKKSIQFRQGDVLFLYTDGVTEGSDKEGNLFGERRLIKVLYQHREDRVKKVVEAVLTNLREFTSGEPQSDDIAMMVIKRLGKK